MEKSLSEEQIRNFHDLGYIKIKSVFSSEEIKEMSDAIDRIKEVALSGTGEFMKNGSKFYVREIANGKKRIEHVNWCGAMEPLLMKYSRDKRITSLVSELLGSRNANHLINQVHFKLPNDGMEFPFHQDSKHRRFGTIYWKDVNGKGSYVNTVVAIDEMNLQNGPLLISENPKKHVGEISPREQKRHLKIAKPVPLSPGDVLVLGPYVIHGSSGNFSGNPRRVLINGFAYPGANSRKFDIPNAGELINLT